MVIMPTVITGGQNGAFMRSEAEPLPQQAAADRGGGPDAGEADWPG
jgi:hypothetical protein